MPAISDEEWGEIEIKLRKQRIHDHRVWVAALYRLGVHVATARSEWASEAVDGVVYQYLHPAKPTTRSTTRRKRAKEKEESQPG